MRHLRPAPVALLTLLLLLGTAACGSTDERAAPAADAASTPTGDPDTSVSDDTVSDDTVSDDTATTMGAAGIGVADLRASATFYSEALGMSELTTFEIPGYMDEIVLGFDDSTRGASVVLMHYTDGRKHDYADNPVKLVFYVPDPTATAAAIEQAGGSIVLEPAPQASLGGAVVGLAKDLDGYTIELLEAGTGPVE
ncbi:putative enzyme related to lactoylglutathione lyase [Mumia flava]|uniref:Putative enzyme related to lactoylglutathione lyase n=1 Tax=Mumia flava TaxID=1348852 RepID=A0A0B2B2H0_9ACTN|nr:VOC family protein [Mumia flava]PJJ54140.1 putative enzyme related to lactoylglutathione lyase [Mumia flava]